MFHLQKLGYDFLTFICIYKPNAMEIKRVTRCCLPILCVTSDVKTDIEGNSCQEVFQLPCSCTITKEAIAKHFEELRVNHGVLSRAYSPYITHITQQTHQRTEFVVRSTCHHCYMFVWSLHSVHTPDHMKTDRFVQGD